MNAKLTATKLSSIHVPAERAGATFTSVGAWQLPESFSTVAAEVAAARQRVAVADASAGGKILAEGNQAEALLQAALGVGELEINQGAAFEGGHAYRLRDDLFYVGTPPAEEASVLKRLNSAAGHVSGMVTVTNITDGRNELVLLGPYAAELLSLLCGLDLHESKFPNQTAKQTSVAKTGQIVIRRDAGGLRHYRLIGARSRGAYLWETILDAGRSLDIVPIGLAALRELADG